MSAELKDCPWCASPGHIVEDYGENGLAQLLYRPQCVRCGAGHGGFAKRSLAVLAWNVRQPTTPPPGDVLEEVARIIDPVGWKYYDCDLLTGVAKPGDMRDSLAKADAILALSTSPIQGGGWRPIEEARDRFIIAAIWHGGRWAVVMAEGLGGGYHDVREGSCVGWRRSHPKTAYFLPLPSTAALPAPPVPSEETK